MQNIITPVFALLFFCFHCLGQTLELGIGLGLSAYDGDMLAEAMAFPKTSGGAGQIQISMHFNERIRAQLFYNRGKIKGSDADFDRDDRNLSFATNLDELGVRGLFHFIPFDPYGQTGSRFTLYAGTGATVFHFNPYTTDFQGQKVFLQKIGTAGQYLPDEQRNSKPYSLFQLGIPLTAGFSLAVTPRVILGLEFDYRVLFTDYIDDIGPEQYPDFDNLLLSNDQAALLTNRRWEMLYDPSLGINPIDVARTAFRNNELNRTFRSIGTSKDVFGFILFKISYILEEISLGGKSKFGCYTF